MDSGQKRLSLIPFSPGELEGFGIVTMKEETEKSEKDMGSGRKRLSLIPLNQDELEVLGLVPKRKKPVAKTTNADKRKSIKKPPTTLNRTSTNGGNRVSRLSRLPKNTTKNEPRNEVARNTPKIKKFELPRKNLQKSGSRKILLAEYNAIPSSSSTNEKTANDKSPLIPLEDAEKYFQIPKIRVDSFEEDQKENSLLLGSTSANSVGEFEDMEKLVKIPTQSFKKQDILDVLKKHREEFETFERAFYTFKESFQKQELFFNKILANIEAQEKAAGPKQENSASNKTQSTARSKLVEKSNDLRVDLLKKTLNTPKTEKAQTLYKDLRKNFPLETPKFDKRDMNSMQQLNISRKLQEQCLLLFDTPRHERN